MTKRYALIAAAILATAATGLPTRAQERVLTPEKAAGFDGVVTQCVSFVRMKFANAMCDRLAGSVGKLAAKTGLPHRHLGRAEWGFGKDEYLTLPADAGFANPVWLTFYVRATDRPVSTFIWASLYAPATQGRPGRLVLWEDSGIGAGSAKQITGGLANGMAKKLEPVFAALAEGKAQ